MATLATPKKHPYVLKQGSVGAFEKNKSTKQEIDAMKRRAEMFVRNNLKTDVK